MKKYVFFNTRELIVKTANLLLFLTIFYCSAQGQVVPTNRNTTILQDNPAYKYVHDVPVPLRGGTPHHRQCADCPTDDKFGIWLWVKGLDSRFRNAIDKAGERAGIDLTRLENRNFYAIKELLQMYALNYLDKENDCGCATFYAGLMMKITARLQKVNNQAAWENVRYRMPVGDCEEANMDIAP
ncbi:hypothetical protein FACS1894162_7730 [Bacteroidia bacterium]|nr:hypothetical protein FACS1894162_7730 [Bacteroidia bacterium]